MHQCWAWLLSHAVLTLVLIALLTGLFLWQFQNLQFDTSSSTLILSGSPENVYYDRIRKVFGGDQVLLVGITSADLLQSQHLRRIRDLTGELENIPGIRRVLSLTNVTDVQGTKDEVLVSPLVPTNLDNLNKDILRARLRSNPFYEKSLISPDGRTASMIVFLEEIERGDALNQERDVTRNVRAAAHKLDSEYQVFIGGLPEMELEGTESMIRDLRLFTPVTLLLVIGILMASFRCLRGIAIPLGVIALTLSWTVGAMVWSGRPLKVTTVILPSLLIANGCSYVIHFLAQYYEALVRCCGTDRWEGKEAIDLEKNRASLLEALRIVHTPLFISAATTMAGFGALALNRIPAVRDLGIFATLGICLSYFFCMTLVPATLMVLPAPRFEQLPGKAGSHRHSFLRELGEFNIHHRGWVYTVALASAVWALWGLFRLEVHTDYLGYFRERAPVVQAAHQFEQRLAGIAPLSVIVETTGQRLVIEPQILKATETLQNSLTHATGMDLTLSVIDILKLLHRAFHDEDPHYFALPSDPHLIGDLIDFAESDPNGLSEDFISNDRKSLRIFGRTHLFSSTELNKELDHIQQEASQLFPADVRVHATGTLVLMNQTSDQVATEQVKGLVVSVLLIVSIVIILLGSWRIGLLVLVPAGLPVFLCFGLMGWSGVSLNVNTSLIANIAIGIAVNNCIHYVVHFRRSLNTGLSISDSTRESLKNVGGPMLATSVALTLGFLVFGFSSFVPVSHFGLLSAFIMGVDLIANLFLLPSLMLSERVWSGFIGSPL
jgi:hypothetical protein